MKTRAAFTKSHYKTGILLLISVCCYNLGIQAQGIRRPEIEARQRIMRQPSIHQQGAPNMSRFPAQARPATPPNAVSGTQRMSGIGRPQVTMDRSTVFDRANNGAFTRPGSGSRPVNGDFNRPDKLNNRPADVPYNRPADVTYNRPARDYNRRDYDNHPGKYSNNSNWGYNHNNQGGYNNNGYNKNYPRPVYNPYNPNWRYAYAPRRNSVFYSLPSSYFSINFGGYGYRYYDGIFYRPYNNIFRVVAPPIGIFVNLLPTGYSRIYVNDYPYYYYNGTYYDQRDNHYVVVSPPVGAVVESLPDGYETVNIDGETYYIADGAQYKPVLQDNGEIWYEVIKAN